MMAARNPEFEVLCDMATEISSNKPKSQTGNTSLRFSVYTTYGNAQVTFWQNHTSLKEEKCNPTHIRTGLSKLTLNPQPRTRLMSPVRVSNPLDNYTSM